MNKVYEKKQTMVDSIQWNGDNYVEVTKFINKYTRKPIQCFTHYGVNTFTINFHSKDVKVVKKGDYIVTENDDALVVPEDVFKKHYKFVGVKNEDLKVLKDFYKKITGEELDLNKFNSGDKITIGGLEITFQ